MDDEVRQVEIHSTQKLKYSNAQHQHCISMLNSGLTTVPEFQDTSFHFHSSTDLTMPIKSSRIESSTTDNETSDSPLIIESLCLTSSVLDQSIQNVEEKCGSEEENQYRSSRTNEFISSNDIKFLQTKSLDATDNTRHLFPLPCTSKDHAEYYKNSDSNDYEEIPTDLRLSDFEDVKHVINGSFSNIFSASQKQMRKRLSRCISKNTIIKCLKSEATANVIAVKEFESERDILMSIK